jgi:hypothetical protein
MTDGGHRTGLSLQTGSVRTAFGGRDPPRTHLGAAIPDRRSPSPGLNRGAPSASVGTCRAWLWGCDRIGERVDTPERCDQIRAETIARGQRGGRLVADLGLACVVPDQHLERQIERCQG